MPARTPLVLVLFLCAWGFLWGQSPFDDAKLARLGIHLDRIRRDAQANREISGAIVLVAGAGVAVTGTALSQFAFRDTWPGNNDVRTLFTMTSIFGGAVVAAPGVFLLVYRGSAETLPEAFATLPATDAESKRAKVLEGELDLQRLSDDARISRYISAGLSGALGVATLASPAWTGTPGSTNGSLTSGLIYLAAAAVTLLLETTPEREEAAYDRWKKAS